MPDTSPLTLQASLPTRVSVREVGLRDGLQILPRTLATVHKKQWIAAAYAAGQREIEVGSFVPAHRLPQMADTAEVLAFARTLPGLCASVLVPNAFGAQRAMEEGADWMLVPLSASHAHSLANLRKSPDEVVQEIARIRTQRDAARVNTRLEVGIGTAFGCTLQGRVDPQEVLRLAQAVVDAGAERLSLADTVGYADPAQVARLLEAVVRRVGPVLDTAHFHDTRGLGLANCYAALQAGMTRLDACLAGLGGCPHAPGASGNVATEDLVYLLASMGIASGQDFAQLVALRSQLAQWLEGETLHGVLWRAGLPKTLAGTLLPA